jgi:hypothetical protein
MKKHDNPVLRTSAKLARARRNRPQERGKLFSAKGRQQATAETPFYDNDRRELRLGTIVVKCFTQGSDAQEIILASTTALLDLYLGMQQGSSARLI